jgi:hypothetical protein
MKGCKGICDMLKSGKPFGSPYKTHCLCKRCDSWFNVKLLIDEKCPCCKFRPKMSSTKMKQDLYVSLTI